MMFIDMDIYFGLISHIVICFSSIIYTIILQDENTSKGVIDDKMPIYFLLSVVPFVNWIIVFKLLNRY